jgi:hypothetical protein
MGSWWKGRRVASCAGSNDERGSLGGASKEVDVPVLRHEGEGSRGWFPRLWWPEKAILVYQAFLLGALLPHARQVESLGNVLLALLFAIGLM